MGMASMDWEQMRIEFQKEIRVQEVEAAVSFQSHRSSTPTALRLLLAISMDSPLAFLELLILLRSMECSGHYCQ
jgi:hypothetical protein